MVLLRLFCGTPIGCRVTPVACTKEIKGIILIINHLGND